MNKEHPMHPSTADILRKLLEAKDCFVRAGLTVEGAGRD